MQKLQELKSISKLTACSYHITCAFQGNPCSKETRYLEFMWLQQDWNPQRLSS